MTVSRLIAEHPSRALIEQAPYKQWRRFRLYATTKNRTRVFGLLADGDGLVPTSDEQRLNRRDPAAYAWAAEAIAQELAR